ncbi:CCR4-NOT transcription complex subunit 7-like isoform X1, partial [Leptotrombidium deliense]
MAQIHSNMSNVLQRNNNIDNVENELCEIKQVWSHNLEAEFRTIRNLVPNFRFIAMETTFPGFVARPIGEFRSTSEYKYQVLQCNVNLLKIMQLGLTFFDENGEKPTGQYSTWQFNFKFDLCKDMYAQDAIDLLLESGVKFSKHNEIGIDVDDFVELFISSGMVLCDNVQWISFDCSSNFGYLLKIITATNLPHEDEHFFELLRIYFPTFYDIKHLTLSCKNLKQSLREVAEQLHLTSSGAQCHAGSNSSLAGSVFFKIREEFFDGD